MNSKVRTRCRRPALLMLLALPALLAAGPAAAAVSAYLPLNLSPELESRVERVLVLAGAPVMTRPIRVATVLDALPAACARNRSLCRQVRRDLAPYLAAVGLTGAGVEAAVTDSNKLPQPNQHGAPMSTHWQAYASGYARFGDHALLSAGAVGYAGRVTATGTMASLGGSRAQLDLGFRDHAWSPFRLGNMLIGTEAPTMPSATLSNVLPLTRAHLRYELFLARMSHSDRIVYKDTLVSGYPELFGFHLEVEPAPGWSLAVNRLMQFGGGPRPHSLHDLFRTFFNPAKYDNFSGLAGRQQFGNEEFAVSSSLVVPVRMPMSVYIEYAGEDTFHAQKYRFGSDAMSAGLFLPQLRPNLQLRYEFSERDTNWYVHPVYGDGLTNYGNVLGNWAGDWRLPGDNVRAQSHALELIWDRDNGAQIDLQYRTARNSSDQGYHYKRGHDLALSLSAPWRTLQVGARLEGGRDALGENFGRIAAFARYSGQSSAARDRGARDEDAAAVQAPDEAELAVAAAGRRSIEAFADIGMFTSHLNYEPDAGALPPVKTPQGSFHLGLGVRRAVNRHNDFGTRLEFDNVRGRLFTALRAIDYRHRFGPTFAASLFFGVGRYEGPTPAYGWYGGAGVQWRELWKQWDLGIDLRRGDHMVRNKTPAEPVLIYPNSFYSITGESIYLSRRF